MTAAAALGLDREPLDHELRQRHGTDLLRVRRSVAACVLERMEQERLERHAAE